MTTERHAKSLHGNFMKTKIIPAETFRGGADTLEISPRQFSIPPNYTWTLSRAGEYRDSGEVSMTAEQWDAWGETALDEDYQLDSICAVLGLTRTE